MNEVLSKLGPWALVLISATKAARWQGRIEGFAIGLGAGYLGGKL